MKKIKKKKATFYLVDQKGSSLAELTSYELLACKLAYENWRLSKRVLLACADLKQAKILDEILWQKVPQNFIPHNLTGEGPKCGAPIEICWPTKRSHLPRDILINLQWSFADYVSLFYEIIDFAPIFDSNLIKLARERYKIYRSIGFNLTLNKVQIRHMSCTLITL